MQFNHNANGDKPCVRKFIAALEGAIHGSFRGIHVPYTESETLANSVLLEVYELLDGVKSFMSDKGVLHACLIIAGENERDFILHGMNGAQFSVDLEAFDNAQIDFLLELVEVVDRRLVYLGLDQKESLIALTNIVFAMCCVIDGGNVAQNQHIGFLPILAFSQSNSRIKATITSGGVSWMQQYVPGIVGKYFAGHFE